MTKLILFFCVLVISQTSIYSQSLTTSDLIERSKCDDFNCFDSYIKTKGFKLGNKLGNSFLYSTKNFTTEKADDGSPVRVKTIVQFTSSESVRTVLITTYDKAIYNSLINKFKMNGLLVSNTRNDSKPNVVNFIGTKKNDAQTEISKVDFDGHKLNQYQITLNYYPSDK